MDINCHNLKHKIVFFCFHFCKRHWQSSNSWFGAPGAPGAPGHWGSHDPLKINTRRKSEVKFIFQNSASLDPRTGLSPLTSPSSPPTPPPRRRYRPTKSLQFTCHGLLSIPHQLLHALLLLLLLLLLLFLTLLQTLVSSSCSSPIINALASPSFATLSPQSISCGLDIKLGHWVPKFPFCSDTDIFQSC